MRSDITFYQHDGELLYDAWERFKDLLRRCPHDSIPDWLQIHIFYNELNEPSRTMIDVAVGGSLNSQTPDEAFQWTKMMRAGWRLTASCSGFNVGLIKDDDWLRLE